MMGNKSKGKYISVLQACIQNTAEQTPRRREILEGSAEEKQLSEEIKTLLNDREKILKALGMLFPGGIPVDLSFYERLHDLQLRIGFGDLINQLIGSFWSVAIQSLSQKSGEALLHMLPSSKLSHFFFWLNSLPFLLLHSTSKCNTLSKDFKRCLIV